MVGERFIPTCVGSAWWRRRHHSPSSVHPHVRGERACVSDPPYELGGSSPRAWGAQVAEGVLLAAERFIPTCVGSANRRDGGEPETSVHPHVRGERPWSVAGGGTPNGSSPRAWGARARPPQVRSDVRFIPTCVGSAEIGGARRVIFAVHPHVRGERVCHLPAVRCIDGSSPRAWGALRGAILPRLVLRFIPTCVGSASTWRWWLRRLAVHPHVRGERARALQHARQRHGSSPRAWGARLVRNRIPPLHRFIPTCVGSAPPGPRGTRGRAVHPHVRGERATPADEVRRLRRFIPTCVGSAP